jgi:hypothetical protein
MRWISSRDMLHFQDEANWPIAHLTAVTTLPERGIGRTDVPFGAAERTESEEKSHG